MEEVTTTPPDSNTTKQVLLGRYELGRLLGQGTFAKVYAAVHLPTNTPVAIKTLHKAHLLRHDMAGQLLREVSAMSRLRHPNIVRLHEVMATRTKVFLSLELVGGGELFDLVAKSKLPESLARRYFRQLLSAVAFCHSRGICHRDLKPENLLLDGNGDLKVSDFGLSALPEQLRRDGLLHTQCGTPAYVAPEMLRKRGYDGAKADLWSCGVVLYVLLAGFLPFRGKNVMAMYRKIFDVVYEFPPWFSPGARRLISRLLVADPEKRITAAEIMEDEWFTAGSPEPSVLDLQNTLLPPPAVVPAGEGKGGEVGPSFYNAFELISAMSSGFDLSGMFESGEGRAGTVFVSRRKAGEVMMRLEGVGKGLGLAVWREKGYKLRMEGWEGRFGVTIEVFEAAEGVAVAELRKTAGDAADYQKFWEEGVRRGLKDVVWTWRWRG